MHAFCLSVAFFVVSQAQGLGNAPKAHTLSLADQTRIIQFAHDHGLNIAELPDTWRLVAEQNGTDALLERLQVEFDRQSKADSVEYLEVKAGSFHDLY